MKTICEIHDKIKELANNKFSNNRRFSNLEAEEYIDIIINLENFLNDISELVDEAKEMGQKMEDGLRKRKEFMIKKDIEEEYTN